MATFSAKVVGGGLNMRASCSTTATRLVQIPNNTAITVETVSGQNAWFKTSYSNKTGYVMAKFVQVTSSSESCTVKTAHTVRQTPSTSGSSSFSATAGQTVRILDKTTASGWYRISGTTGTQGTGWSQTTNLNLSAPSMPDGSAYAQAEYGSTINLYQTPDVNTATILGTIPNNTLLSLWHYNEDNIYFQTVYNNTSGYVCIYDLNIVEPNTNTLQQGSTGFGVIRYKKILFDLGYHTYNFSSVYNGTMVIAVRLFQSKNGLSVDGVIGPSTRAQLNSSSAVAWSDSAVTNWQNTMNGTTAPKQWYMNDSQWGSFPWPHTTGAPETIGDSGNSITAMAMVLTTFHGRAITPAEMADFTIDKEYRDSSGTQGVKDTFYSQISNHYYAINYDGVTTSMSTVQSHIANGGLAIATVTADANQTYTAGATQLVIYGIDSNGVHVLSPNQNKDPNYCLPFSAWNGASWFKKAYLYSIVWG